MSDGPIVSIGAAVRGADRGFRVIDGGPPKADGVSADDPCPVTVLGHLGGILHFLDARGQKRELTSRQIGSRHDLLVLFGGDEAWLRRNHPRRVKQIAQDGSETWVTVDFAINAAASWLIAGCFAAGLFGEQVVLRRSGVWPGPGGLPAVHCGDKVLIEGDWKDAGFRSGAQIWAATPPTPRPALPVGGDVAVELGTRLRDYWNWEHPGAPIVMIGLIANAYLGAAIAWRPPGFVIGGTGSGKSRLMDVLRAAIPLHFYTNDTSKAGIEQAIAGRAMASLIDEAGDRADRDSSRALVDLVLSATGGDGTRGSRGTSDGRGRSVELSGSVLMFSINPPDLEPQHLGRFVIVGLEQPTDGRDFRTQHVAAASFARMHGAALWGRALGAFERYQAALDLFRAALGRDGCAPREMDQLGALIAGWWILTHEGLPDARAQAEGVGALDGFVRRADDVMAEDRPQRAVQHLMASTVELSRSSDKETIGRMLEIAWGDPLSLRDPVAAAEVLQRYGIRPIARHQMVTGKGALVPRGADGDGAWLMRGNPKLRLLFDKTPWDGARWEYEVRRLPTSRQSGRAIRCGGTSGRAIWLSRTDLTGDDAGLEEIPP